MRYDRRITFASVERVELPMGYDEQTVYRAVPCAISPLSVSKQAELFGSVNRKVFKVHVQGHPKPDAIYEHDPSKAEEQLKQYSIQTSVRHRRETVFYVEG